MPPDRLNSERHVPRAAPGPKSWGHPTGAGKKTRVRVDPEVSLLLPHPSVSPGLNSEAVPSHSEASPVSGLRKQKGKPHRTERREMSFYRYVFLHWLCPLAPQSLLQHWNGSGLEAPKAQRESRPAEPKAVRSLLLSCPPPFETWPREDPARRCYSTGDTWKPRVSSQRMKRGALEIQEVGGGLERREERWGHMQCMCARVTPHLPLGPHLNGKPEVLRADLGDRCTRHCKAPETDPKRGPGHRRLRSAARVWPGCFLLWQKHPPSP